MDKLLKLFSNVEKINNIVIITGAGISSESGIETFRGNNSLWKKYSIYEVARPEAMILTPDIFYSFQNNMAEVIKKAEPNSAHMSILKLEKKFNITIITQNIDNLHEKAGNINVNHIHGKISDVICNSCNHETFYSKNIFGKRCSRCENGFYRPDIVLFKESVKNIKQSKEVIKRSDLFLQVGTSGIVSPVRNFPELANCMKINISLEKPQNINFFDYDIKGYASIEVPKLVSFLLDNF